MLNGCCRRFNGQGRLDFHRRPSRTGRQRPPPQTGGGRVLAPAHAHPRRIGPDRAAGAVENFFRTRKAGDCGRGRGRRSAESRRTTIGRWSSCSRTSRSRTTSSRRRMSTGCASSSSSAAPASTRSSLRSRSRRAHCSRGPLEPTNEAYAIAKIAGIKLCQAYAREYGANFISAMPTNLYGPNDNFDLESFARAPRAPPQGRTRRRRAGAREIMVWGTGTPRREFLHVDDLAARLPFPPRKLRQPRDHQHR